MHMTPAILIDGENFKGKIKGVFKDAGKDKPVWHEYDFKGLLELVLAGTDTINITFYFAKIKLHKESEVKSKELIEEQRRLKTHLENQGIKVLLAGRVRGFEEIQNGKKSLVFKEKGVDVKIAVDMVSMSCDRSADSIVLGSSDSDLQPAIEEVKKRGGKCTYLGFETQPNKGMSFTTGRTVLIRNSEVLSFEKRQPPLQIV